jgi:NAD+ kinase
MPISRAGLIARFTLPAAVGALVEAASWLEAHGCTPVVEQESAHAARLEHRWPTAAREAIAGEVDVIIAFGGDGTLLDAAGVVAYASESVPVLGVNLGHLGFLTEVGQTDLVGALDALLAGRARIDTRLMLRGQVERGGQIVAERVALNDIVVTRGALSRMIETDVTVDGHFVCHVKADGVILATATGSTAYNLSAGGPIVHPSVDAFVLTPIAPHTLTNRPLVLPATAQVTLRPLVESPPADIVATFDGQFGLPLAEGDVVVLTRAPRLLQLVRTSARTHFDMLREKLKWGNS